VGWQFWRSSRTRFFDSSFAAYWSARRAGASHEDALLSVAHSRSFLDEALASMGPATKRSDQESAEVKALVWLIACNESGRPRTADAHRKMTRQLEESFARVEVRERLAAIGTRA